MAITGYHTPQSEILCLNDKLFFEWQSLRFGGKEGLGISGLRRAKAAAEEEQKEARGRGEEQEQEPFPVPLHFGSTLANAAMVGYRVDKGHFEYG